MSPRNLGWQDGWLVFRYRRRAVCLSARRHFTGQEGWPGGWWGLLFPSAQVLSGVDERNGHRLLAWGELTADGHTCWVTHLAPVEGLESTLLPRLLEHLARQAGQRGARHLALEVPEEAPFLPRLQQAGLAPLARMRLWRWVGEGFPNGGAACWQPLSSADLGEAQALWHARVPPKVRAVLPYPQPQGDWWLCRRGSALLGLVWIAQGPRGVWGQLWLSDEAPRQVQEEALRALSRTWEGVLWLSTLAGDGAEDRALEAVGAQTVPSWLILARPVGLPVSATAPTRAEQATITQPLRPIVPHS